MTELALATPRPTRTFGTLSVKKDAWVLSDIEPHVAIRLKQIFPRIAKSAVAPFRLSRSLATDSDLLWFTKRYALRMDPKVEVELNQGQDDYVRLQAAMEAILLPDYAPPSLAGVKPGQAMRAYQAQAVDLCYASEGLLLGDDCGLGKTYVGCGLCLKPGTQPVAIVCQGHIQSQWVDRLHEFTTLRVHEVRTRMAYSLPAADVYVFRYTQIIGWTDIFAEQFFKTVIYDEPQELRTGTKSEKGKAALELSNHATWRLGLTATPIYNYGSEIWSIMRCISPAVLGEYADFSREWTVHGSQRLADPKALGTFLREQHVFLRRTKADVGKELEPVNRIVDFVDFDEDKVASVEELARALALRATQGSFTDRGTAARELDLMVRHATGVAKAKSVAARARIIVESGEPLLLAGWHRDVYDIWLKELADLKPAMHTGSESKTQKRAAVEAFIAGKTDLLIMSLRSGAGLDGLQQRCSTIGIGELDWSPGVHHQLIERLDREGQTRPVMALFFVTDDGSDPPIMELLGLKASDAHQVIDPTLQATEVHSDETRLQALLRRYLDKRDAPPPPSAAAQGQLLSA